MTGERILVIDDEEIICTLLKDTLTDAGYQVETVTNGIEGLEKLLKGEPFDILLTDIRMPKKDGMQVLKEAKNRVPDIITIIMTGYPSIETIRESSEYNAFDYITKPLDPDEVCECIKHSLEVRKLSRDLRVPEKPPSILVVDDMQSALFLSEGILQDEGYHAEIAQNGQEVLDRLKQKHFDIIVADLHMPGMDGIELLNNIKKLDIKTLVIIMTARPSIESAITAFRHGAYDYITKPIDPDTIINTIQRGLEKRHIEVNTDKLLRRIHDLRQQMINENTSLVKEKDMANSIIDAAPDAIIATDEHANICIINDAARELFGYRKEELMGKPVDTLFAEKKNFFKGTDLETMLREGNVYNCPLTCITNKGAKIKTTWSGAPILDKDERIKGVVGIGRK
ncbi:MAG TPA: response regulator [Candidatus Wunengus sp. YC60]|uniref:response regulator n=1 Tax=Candidatus Wunengus sp. YC60 TaxID=3367697 RepID=UPI0040273E1E